MRRGIFRILGEFWQAIYRYLFKKAVNGYLWINAKRLTNDPIICILLE
jgi:hypothetical protein